MTRTELIDRYLAHARLYYRRADGTPTRHADNLELGLRPLRSDEPAESFSFDDLRDYRDGLIARGLVRRTINQWVGWVKALYRWAAREKLLPASIAAELAILDPLRFGRSPAKESRPPRVISRRQLIDTLPVLLPTVATMVRVQWLTGMRCEEVCLLQADRLAEVDDYLVYTPDHHKSAHHDRHRQIVIPRAARELLDLTRPGYQWTNQIGNPWNRSTYSGAIRRACRRAGIPHFAPGHLRRSAATHARRLVGKEGVQRLLGHASGDTTEIYLGLDVIDAIEAARRLDESGWSLDAGISAEPLADRSDRV